MPNRCSLVCSRSAPCPCLLFVPCGIYYVVFCSLPFATLASEQQLIASDSWDSLFLAKPGFFCSLRFCAESCSYVVAVAPHSVWWGMTSDHNLRQSGAEGLFEHGGCWVWFSTQHSTTPCCPPHPAFHLRRQTQNPLLLRSIQCKGSHKPSSEVRRRKNQLRNTRMAAAARVYDRHTSNYVSSFA